ncbi:probable G-protein coupled receptor 171 [Anguilla anguilla]|uniref:probable G-protein coupled receptor 171 n=1 Tax=Anguilla anguilla TaxID=7936 RepID=UPI0015AE2B0F|nr:probable G-protein coupled receptor 171 [Anguilla anguilla]XP_035277241.1 probable G-protein coupled receptor 171 [Anguilla anguilla]
MEAVNSTVSCRPSGSTAPFTVLYALAFLVGLGGTLTALWGVARCRGDRRSIDVYLLNLLASALLLTLALPFKIATSLGVASWGLQVFHCQASAVVVYISLYVSLLLLALVSADRYLQISQSPRLRCAREPGLARVLSAVAWALVLFIMVPNMAIPTRDVPEKQWLRCAELKREEGLHWHRLASFLGTGIFLNASLAVLAANGLALRRLWANHHRRHGADGRWLDARRTARHVATVTLAYVVCFVPYHAVRTPYTLTQGRPIHDCPQWNHLYLAKEATLLLAVLHVCFNPVLYFHFSRSFRQRLKQTFRPKGNSSAPPRDMKTSLPSVRPP